jgi:hypothetical protein
LSFFSFGHCIVCVLRFAASDYPFGSVTVSEKKKLSDEKEDTPYIVPKYPHLLAERTKFETFYFQIFCLKRWNQLIRGKLSSLLYVLNSICIRSFQTQLTVFGCRLWNLVTLNLTNIPLFYRSFIHAWPIVNAGSDNTKEITFIVNKFTLIAYKKN